MASVNNEKESQLFEGQKLLYMQGFGYLKSMCLKWAIEVGIPDIIFNHGKPITLPELVSSLQLPPAKGVSVQRFMRFLAHNRIFDIHESKEDREVTYALTPASKLLVSGSDHCLTPMVLLITDPLMMSKYHRLGEWIHGDDPTLFETVLGTTLWGLLDEKPAYFSLFKEAMASDSQMVDLALKNCGSVFEQLHSIVDVGGGIGTTGRIICQAFPNLKSYVVLDLPSVVAKLTGTHNLSFLGGDMFKSIPPADAVLLKWILHNWNDKNCIKILEKCKDSISSKGNRGKVIIIDTVLNENLDYEDMTQTKLCMDIGMMSMNGKERTEEEWKQLFVEAGFKNHKIFPIFGFRSLIEVYP